MTVNMNTEFGIIDTSLDDLEKKLRGVDDPYTTVYRSRKIYEIVRWLEEHKATDAEYSIEIYETDEDGEFLRGSDFDSVSNFLHRQAYMVRSLSGLTQSAFSEKYGIPNRTIETWEATSESARRTAPGYVLMLLERAVREDSRAEKE